MFWLMMTSLGLGCGRKRQGRLQAAPSAVNTDGTDAQGLGRLLPLLPELADVVLVAEQKIRAHDAMVEAVRPKAVIDEPDFPRAPVQRARSAVDASRRRPPQVIDAVEGERARLMLVAAADELDAMLPR